MILHPDCYDFDSLNFHTWDVADLAWAAGFIDGDGCISMYQVKRVYRKYHEFKIQLSAVNTNLECLQKLQLMFGGSINVMHKGDDERNWKKSWIWIVTHRRAARVLEAIGPYMLIKHERAVLALESRSLVDVEHRKHRSDETINKLIAIRDRFSELNRKGK